MELNMNELFEKIYRENFEKRIGSKKPHNYLADEIASSDKDIGEDDYTERAANKELDIEQELFDRADGKDILVQRLEGDKKSYFAVKNWLDFEDKISGEVFKNGIAAYKDDDEIVL